MRDSRLVQWGYPHNTGTEPCRFYSQKSTAKFSTDSIMVSSEEADTASMTSSLSSPVDRFFTSHCSTSSSFLRSPEEEEMSHETSIIQK